MLSYIKGSKECVCVWHQNIESRKLLKSGTPAARMKRVPTGEVKKRSRKLTTLFESFSPYNDMNGLSYRVLVTDIATDGIHLVYASLHSSFVSQ